MDILTEKAGEQCGITYLYPYQRLVITNILEAAGCYGEKREEESPRKQIVILPTGSGKSLCFTLPGIMLPGITLIIYPLIALMADQYRRFTATGAGAAILKGGQKEQERRELFHRAREGQIQFILTNPETMQTPRVLKELNALHIVHIVIDEAHTASEWGESFRPAFLTLGEVLENWEVSSISQGEKPPIITAFTATASPYILKRIREILFGQKAVHTLAGNPDRPNISYQVIPSLSKSHDLSYLFSSKAYSRPAIVFCRSRPSTEVTTRMLRVRLGSGNIFFYHAGLTREEKEAVEKWFFESKEGILCSTCAYGMGVDKSDIRTIIHRDLPPSVEAYLQESGRGGRDGKSAKAVLLLSHDDINHPLVKDDGFRGSRYREILAWAMDSARCRRDGLLALLGAEEVHCDNCDVCLNEIRREPGGGKEIRQFMKGASWLTPRMITASLSGTPGFTVDRHNLKAFRGFGTLSGWKDVDIEEALDSLLFEGILIKRKGQIRIKR